MNMKILIALLIGGLLVTAGYSFGRTSSPTLPSSTGNPSSNSCGPGGCGNNSMVHNIEVTDEKAFIREMIPHHQEAIDTSQLVLAQTQDPELKKFTQDVIAVQTTEVREMKGWLQSWFNEEYTTNSNYMPMMGDLSSFEGEGLDKVYVEGMIRHHQGAIEMARKVLALNPRPEIKKMADDIITVQQSEVTTLQGWLATKYQGIEAKDETHHMMNIR